MSKNCMFQMNFGENNINIANMAYEDKIWLCRFRYVHFNFHSLKLLTSKESVYGFPNIEENKVVYERCGKGKDKI